MTNPAYSVSMKPPKQNRPQFEVDLAAEVGRSDAWGTDQGSRVFARLNSALMGLDDGTLVLIDYRGLERSDVSFQREAVVETIRKHRPKLLFVVVNLDDPDLCMNLDVALDRRGDVLLLRRGTRPTVLGRKLPDEHRLTLERVWDLGEVTSATLVAGGQQRSAGQKNQKAKLSTTSSRLIALWKAGLIARVEGTSSTGGREHRYYSFY